MEVECMAKKNEEKIKIQFIGAVNDEVTGSCTYVNVDGLHIIIDYGLVQSNLLTLKELYKLNSKELPVPIEKIDYLLLLHSHSDHTCSTPRLTSNTFNGKIMCTHLTAQIIEPLFYDSAYIQQKEIIANNKKDGDNQMFPLYTKSDVEEVMNYVQGYNFDKEIFLSDKVSIKFLKGGHVSGASCLELEYRQSEYTKKRLLFTSDTSGINRNIPFTAKPNIEKKKYDFILTEATYGNRSHLNVDSKEELKNHIQDTIINKKGNLLIPVFAYHRSTTIIAMLKDIYDESPEFRDIKIYLASPLAIKIHKIITEDNSFEFYDKEWEKYKDLFNWDKISYIDSFKDVESGLAGDINSIVLCSSGMVGSGGYSSYLTGKYIINPSNKILMSGYQAEGIAGNTLLNTNKKTIFIDGMELPILADIALLNGMSGHADSKELVDMLKTVEKKKVKVIAINHGSNSAKKALKEKLKEEFNCEIIIPQEGQILKI